MKSFLVAAASILSFSLLANTAAADQTGVLHSINHAEKTITIIEAKTGEKLVFPLANNARVVVDGRRQSLRTALARGQEVVLKFRASENTLSLN